MSNYFEDYDRGWSQGRIDLKANVLAELKKCAEDYKFDFDEYNYKLVEKIFNAKCDNCEVSEERR